jgi:hypothetical protein
MRYACAGRWLCSRRHSDHMISAATMACRASFTLQGLLLSAVCIAQTPEQFAKHAATVTIPTRTVIGEAKPAGWIRSELSYMDIKYDVQRTDSLLRPVVAKVNLSVVFRLSERVGGRDSAESAPLPEYGERVERYRVELEYVPTGTGWAFSLGRYYSPQLRTWFDIKPAEATPQPGKRSMMGDAVRAFEIP